MLREFIYEMIVFLKKNSLLGTTDTTRVVGTLAGDDDNFSLQNNELKFILNMKNIDDPINKIDLKYGKDYTINFTNNTITFTNPDNITKYEYEYETNEKSNINYSFPQYEISIDTYPLISLYLISGNINEITIGAKNNLKEYKFSINIYSTDETELLNLMSDVENLILNNKLEFHHAPLVTVNSIGPILPSVNSNERIFQVNVDIDVEFIIE